MNRFSRERHERRTFQNEGRTRQDSRRRALTSQSRREALQSARDSLDALGIQPFHVEFRRLMRIVGAQEFSGDRAGEALTRAQLADAIGRLALLSKSEDSRSAYAAVALGDHIRGLVQDVRQFGDNAETVRRVRDECVTPGLRHAATDVVAAVTRLRTSANQGLDGKARGRIDAMLRAFQDELGGMFAQHEVRMSETLDRALNRR